MTNFYPQLFAVYCEEQKERGFQCQCSTELSIKNGWVEWDVIINIVHYANCTSAIYAVDFAFSRAAADATNTIV